MSYIIIAACVLAMAHFVYEGIVAPTLLTKRRFRLFELRDQVRQLKLEKPDAADEWTFHRLQERVNFQIRYLDQIDAVAMVKAQYELDRDPKMKAEVEKKVRRLTENPSAEAREINTSIARAGASAILVNSGGWMLYVLPFFFLHAIYEWMGKQISEVLSMPDASLKRAVARKRRVPA